MFSKKKILSNQNKELERDTTEARIHSSTGPFLTLSISRNFAEDYLPKQVALRNYFNSGARTK